EVLIDSNHLTKQQEELLGIRMPTLDAESDEDFVVGLKKMVGAVPAQPEMTARLSAYLKSKGLSMLDDTTMTAEQCFNTLMGHPDYAAQRRIAQTAQHIMWDRAIRVFHGRVDYYLDELDKSDKTGPGRIE